VAGREHVGRWLIQAAMTCLYIFDVTGWWVMTWFLHMVIASVVLYIFYRYL
jgi:hypothetical protein